MNNIQQARKKIKYSPEHLAKVLGVKTAKILDWESEKSNPSPRQLTELADFVGETENYLKGETNASQNEGIEFREVNKPWRKDEIEDYENAKSDDERRKILKSFGIDRDHFNAYKSLYLKKSNK